MAELFQVDKIGPAAVCVARVTTGAGIKSTLLAWTQVPI